MNKILLTIFLGILFTSILLGNVNATPEVITTGISSPSCTIGVSCGGDNQFGMVFSTNSTCNPCRLTNVVRLTGSSIPTIELKLSPLGSAANLSIGTFVGNNASFDYTLSPSTTYYLVHTGEQSYVNPITFPIKGNLGSIVDGVGGITNTSSYLPVIYSITLDNAIIPSLSVNLTKPDNNTKIVGSNLTYFFSSNYSSGYANITNATLKLYYQNGTIFKTNYSVVNMALNFSNLSISGIPQETFLWNYYVCGRNSTLGTLCSSASTNRTFVVASFSENSYTFNLTSYETKTETLILNVTVNSTLSSANLVYNGTSYSSSITCSGSESCVISNVIDIPLLSDGSDSNNNTFYWNLNFGTFSQQSSMYQHNVSSIHFGLCNTTLTQTYVNYTFKDELNSSSLLGSISSSNFYYWIGSGKTFRQYSFTNSSQNPSYSFCFIPQDKIINLNYSISYESTSYPTRSYYSGQITFSNTTLNKTLYLLPITSGQIVTFQIVNNAQQPLVGVFGNATRIISGINTVIGSGISGSDGGISFFLDPLLTYTFAFSKEGYTTQTLTTNPSQSSYTITMGGTIQATIDYTRGISQTIQPPSDILINGTVYNFNYTINSSYWNLDSFGFFIYGNNTDLLAAQSSTSSSGGIISSSVNTGNYTTIIMNYYYIVNGTYVNSSETWYISNYGDTGYSISNFFNDFKSYVTLGIFGATNWSIGLLVFFIIFIAVGIVSFKFGFPSPAAIISIVAGLVIFFDVGLGFDSYLNPLASTGAVPYLPSVIVLLIAIAEILRESR